MKYSIIKAILVYHPSTQGNRSNVSKPKDFVDELRAFSSKEYV